MSPRWGFLKHGYLIFYKYIVPLRLYQQPKKKAPEEPNIYRKYIRAPFKAPAERYILLSNS